MSSLSDEYKGLAEKAPDHPGAIYGNLEPGKMYCRKCVFPDDGHHKPCSDEFFIFGEDMDKDGKFFWAWVLDNDGSYWKKEEWLSYGDRGVKPYLDKNGNITGWHRTHFVIPVSEGLEKKLRELSYK